MNLNAPHIKPNEYKNLRHKVGEVFWIECGVNPRTGRNQIIIQPSKKFEELVTDEEINEIAQAINPFVTKIINKYMESFS